MFGSPLLFPIILWKKQHQHFLLCSTEYIIYYSFSEFSFFFHVEAGESYSQFTESLHVITKKTATLSSCVVSHEKAFSPSSIMTPAESVATSNDCPHESPQTISYGKLLQNDCDSHGCRKHRNTLLEKLLLLKIVEKFTNCMQNNSIPRFFLLPLTSFLQRPVVTRLVGASPLTIVFSFKAWTQYYIY